MINVPLKELSHRLKDSSGNIGALQMQHLCSQIEENDFNANKTMVLTANLENEYGNVIKILKAMRREVKER